MNNEERIKLVFETISKIAGFEVKPYKDFYIWSNGNRIKYHIRSDLTLMYEYSKGHYEKSNFTVLPILNGGYKLEEIKEPTVTNEEKGLLRGANFDTVEVLSRGDKYDEYSGVGNYTILKLEYKLITNNKFEGLEKGKKYSRKELGL